MTMPLLAQHVAMSVVLIGGFLANRLSLHRTARRQEAQEATIAQLVTALNDLLGDRNDELVRENQALYAAAVRAGLAVPGVLPRKPTGMSDPK